jgi:cell division septum initiation protein DivIVA
MYSITDAHKALSCGRSTVYSIMKEAGIETTKSGLSQLMTDEQFQRLQEIYFEKYPNRKPKEFIQERSSTFRVDLESNEVEVLESKQQTRSYEDVLEEKAKIFARAHQRDAEHIEDLRKQLEGKDRIIESLLEIIKNQKEPASEPKASAIIQRTPVKFPEYDPNVDTLTGNLFEQPVSEQPSGNSQNLHEQAVASPAVESVGQIQKQPSWPLEAFSEDGPPLSPDEAMIRYFKGRFPQRTPDMPDLLRYLEESGFPHTRDAASTRLAKLRRKQRAARESGEL